MIDLQSATADIRWRKKLPKKEITGRKYNVCMCYIHTGTRNCYRFLIL